MTFMHLLRILGSTFCCTYTIYSYYAMPFNIVLDSTLISITFVSALLSFAYCTLEYYCFMLPAHVVPFVSSDGWVIT